MACLRFAARSAGRMALAVIMAAALPLGAVAQPAAVEAEATRLLKASTDFVAKQKAFSVDTRNSLEIVTTSGQKIQFNHAASAFVQRPNKLRAERTGDLVEQVFFYDGKTLTLLNKSNNVHATTAAPATIEEMLEFARTRLDIVAPAGDLLDRNAYAILMTDVTEGFVVGKGIINGVRCYHLAFRAPHVDWQIWIEEGSRPLPRKLVITTRDLAGGPQFSVEMTKWNLKPKFSAQTFAFQAPKDGRRVEFLPLGTR